MGTPTVVTATYGGLRPRGGQQAFARFALETNNGSGGAGMIAPGVVDGLLGGMPAAPASYANIGYCDTPSITVGQNGGEIRSIGAYQALAQTKGRRDITARVSMRLGNYNILRYGLRTGGINTTSTCKGLPVMSLAGGAYDQWGDGFTWAVRYALMREFSFSFNDSPNSPVTANAELWGCGLDPAGTLVAHTGQVADIKTVAGPQLMWQHARWIISVGGVKTEFKSILKSVNVTVTNELERVNCNFDYGDDKIGSRTPIQIIPLSETVRVSYTLHDKLPDSFLWAAANSLDLGQIILEANDAKAGGSKTMTCTIDNNMVNNLSMQGVQPGAKLDYSMDTMSSFLSITE